MSFKSLLSHRCDFYDQVTLNNDGSPITKYVKVNDRPVRCRLDLVYVRSGKDSQWMPTAAHSTDRTGVLFLPTGIEFRSGMRIHMTRGPEGAFQIQGAIDDIYGYTDPHHIEVGVLEVPSLHWRGEFSSEMGTQ